MQKDSNIFVSGYLTLEGHSLVNYLKEQGYEKVLLESEHLSIDEVFISKTPEYVFLLGDSSGGISANIEKPATLMIQNLHKMNKIINLALKYGTKKLLYLASSCIYPRDISEDLSPEMIMTGPLEPTNAGYATAKLTGLELIKSIRKEYNREFISAISANCFGPYDDFNSDDAHVVSSLFRRTQQAKLNKKDSLLIWGTGKPVRDFIFNQDLSDGLVFLMKNYDKNIPINISTGKGVSIKNLAKTITEISGYHGSLEFDETKPDGMLYKVLDNTEISNLGWSPKYSLERALKSTYDWYLENVNLLKTSDKTKYLI